MAGSDLPAGHSSEYARRVYVRTKARSMGLDPDELDFDDAKRNPTFSPSGFPKSVEITALIRLLERRWHDQNAKKSTRSRSTV